MFKHVHTIQILKINRIVYNSQSAIACLKFKIETLEQVAKYVQS